ncbi:unnamed protein product [Paramecium sonneborni]|uniref:Uncharacterized protein n=1 Tax=Paramecium sonneborni TaxID=65129 RepID=A0A8S1RSK3_9CILI|nr:unnamed protein product [Paramecium sonneborni]
MSKSIKYRQYNNLNNKMSKMFHRVKWKKNLICWKNKNNNRQSLHENNWNKMKRRLQLKINLIQGYRNKQLQYQMMKRKQEEEIDYHQTPTKRDNKRVNRKRQHKSHKRSFGYEMIIRRPITQAMMRNEDGTQNFVCDKIQLESKYGDYEEEAKKKQEKAINANQLCFRELKYDGIVHDMAIT